MRQIIFLILVTLTISLFPGVVKAQYNTSCPSIYGAKCPTGNLFIDKKIQNPTTGEFVETLNANEANFLIGQEINFKIEVKNTGNVELKNINIQDRLPTFTEFVSGPGKLDTGTNILSWVIGNLKPGESQFFDLKVKIKSDKGLPQKGMTCLTNFAEADTDKLSAQDMAGFCIQTQILGQATELPQTGVGETATLVMASFLTLLAGIFLFNKFKKI